MFFYVFCCSIVKVNHYLRCLIILSHLVFPFLHIKCLLVPQVYVSTESIGCILLSSFTLNVILLSSSVKTLCLLLLTVCCVFDINLKFLYEFIMVFYKTFCFNFNFFKSIYSILKLICF